MLRKLYSEINDLELTLPNCVITHVSCVNIPCDVWKKLYYSNMFCLNIFVSLPEGYLMRM